MELDDTRVAEREERGGPNLAVWAAKCDCDAARVVAHTEVRLAFNQFEELFGIDPFLWTIR